MAANQRRRNPGGNPAELPKVVTTFVTKFHPPTQSINGRKSIFEYIYQCGLIFARDFLEEERFVSRRNRNLVLAGLVTSTHVSSKIMTWERRGNIAGDNFAKFEESTLHKMKSFRFFCSLVDADAPVEAVHDALKNNDLDIANQLVLLGLYLPYGKSGTTWEDLAARLQFIYFAAISVANFGTYAVLPEMRKCFAHFDIPYRADNDFIFAPNAMQYGLKNDLDFEPVHLRLVEMQLNEDQIECAKEVYICSNHDSPDNFITVAEYWHARVERILPQDQRPPLPDEFHRPPPPKRIRQRAEGRPSSNRRDALRSPPRDIVHPSPLRNQSRSRSRIRSRSRSRSATQPGINVVVQRRRGRIQTAIIDTVDALRLAIVERNNLDGFLENGRRIRASTQLTAVENLVSSIVPNDEFDQLIEGVNDLDTLLRLLYQRVVVSG